MKPDQLLRDKAGVYWLITNVTKEAVMTAHRMTQITAKGIRVLPVDTIPCCRHPRRLETAV
jgi:hypothetical protein